MRSARRCDARLALAAMLALGMSDPLAAQQAREAAATRAAAVSADSARAKRFAPANPEAPRHAPLPLVMLGAATGGVILFIPGALVAAAPANCHDIICGTQALGALSAVAGYVVGVGLGARFAARVQGERPPVSKVLMTSILAAIAGGVLWNRIGDTFEPKEPMTNDSRARYWGAAAGIAFHLTVTSLVAQHAVRQPPVIHPVPAPTTPPLAPATSPPASALSEAAMAGFTVIRGEME